MSATVRSAIEVLSTWERDTDQNRVYENLVNLTKSVFERGGKLIFCGNGGSAAEAAHLAGEFIGKCSSPSYPLPAIALSESSVQFSATTNDYGFDQTFVRGLRAFAGKDDLVILMSTSGKSLNIQEAISWCKKNDIVYSLWTSQKCPDVLQEPGLTIVAPTQSTPRAQELHLLLGHILAERIESFHFE